MKEKTTLSHEVVCFQMLDFETKVLNLRSRNQITSFSKTRSLFEGAVSHNVLYHHPLPITRNQERFYDGNYFE